MLVVKVHVFSPNSESKSHQTDLGLYSIILLIPSGQSKERFRSRSVLQNSMCLLCILLLIGFSTNPTFCGIFVCGPLLFKCQFITYFGDVGLL